MDHLPNKLLTVAQAAYFLGFSTKTLRRWDMAGQLVPQRTIGNQRRYLLSQLIEFKKNPPPKNNATGQSYKYNVIASPDEHRDAAIPNGLNLPKERYLPFPNNIKPSLMVGALIIGIAGLSLLSYGGLKDFYKIRSPVPKSSVLGTKVLSEETVVPDFVFSVNVPAHFYDDVTFAKAFNVNELTANSVIADNLIYSLKAGSGLSVSSGQTPTITNSGVLSLGGSTGALSLTAGSGISVSGLSITNSDTGSAQNIFKTYSVSGQSDITTDSNTDTFTFAAGDRITLTTDATNDKLTITGLNPGWTDDGTTVRLTTATDNVGIGTAITGGYKLKVEGNLFAGSTAVFNSWVGIGTSTPTSELHVVGAGLFSGNLGVGSSLTVDGPAVLNGNIGLGSSANDAVTFNGRLATSTAILPINDLGADLGSASLRFNNIYVANINTSVAQSYVGQVTFTYEPADTTYTEGSVLINPTNPPANSTLLGVGIAGYERARIDAEGDIILGYNEEISAPVTSYPLTIYNHDFTMVAYVDTSGNANFNGMINVGVGLTTPKLTMTNGAQNNYILRSDAAGNATWVEPHSSGIGETYNSNNGITLDPDTRYFQLGGALIQDTRLNIGNTEVFFIDYPTGYVGIGTTASTYLFTIEGSSNNYLSYIGNGNTGASAGGLYIRSDGEAEILRLNYQGSDIYTFSPTQAVFNAPTNFTASGDVSIANDLNFTNTTSSYINSIAPLTIQAGRDYNSDDLTLRTYNAGNIILESANLWADGSYLGIGTTNPFGPFMVGIGNTQAFIVASSGNVGIGTTAVAAYALNVNGSINVGNSGIFNTLGIGSTTMVANLNADMLDNLHASYFLGVGTTGAFTTGTGTTNFVSKWSSSKILTDSLLYDNGTLLGTNANFGVGTTNPLYNLHVNGSGLFTTLGVGATNINYPLYTSGNFGVGGTAYFASYVGLGTTAPAYQLDLVGNSANYLASINNGNTGASSAGLYVRVDGTGNILNLNYAGSDIFTVTQAQSTFNNTVNFTASGDVSIANDLNFTNTTASYIKSDSSLVLESGEIFNSSDLTLRTFNTGNIILESANLWADGTNVGIGTTNPFGKFMVGIGNTQAFIVSSGGNVGLGTTNPIALLETDGTSWLRGSTTQQGLYVNSSGLVGVGITNPLYGLHINGTGLVSTFFGVGATNPNYSLYTNAKLGVASTAYFASYVGIGTTDPRAKLDIVGSESEFVALKLTNAGEAANQLVSLKFINGDPDWNTDTGAIKSKYYTGGTDGDLSFWTRESGTTYQRMVINNLGSVGIGTTDPTYKLDVTGNTNVGGTATVTTLAIGATNPITPLAIANLTTTAGTALVVDADGNVYKTSSSRRFKENIADYSDDFAKILQIQPKSFNYKATGAPDIGYIAEDLDELGLSSLVIYDKLGQPSAIKYDRISLYLLEILKKQEEKIVALSAEINESTPNVDILLQDATSSAYLKGIRVENDIQLTENIILDGNLNVLGQATFGEIGVTGKITNGLLVINGLDESGSASISTLSGPLELQKNSLGNIEMMDGRVIVDTKGNITISGEVTAKKYNVDETDTASASVGEGIILADNFETLIETTAASESSRIFVSPKEAAVPLGVSEQNKGSFKVILEKKLSKDLKFSWWVIN